MSDIVKSYINKTLYIYERVSELQRLERDKTDSLKSFSNFREYIAKNDEIIKQFKSISGDICQMIFNGNFSMTMQHLYYIGKVRDIINQVKANISKIKSLFTNVQVAEFEKLIEDCFNDMTFSTRDNYEKKLEDANKNLRELFDQLKAISDLAKQIKANINETKCLIEENYLSAVLEFMRIGNINNITKRLTDEYYNDAAKLEKIIEHFNVNEGIPYLLPEEEEDLHTETEKLAEDCNNNILPLRNENYDEVLIFEKLIEDCLNNVTIGTVGSWKTKLENVSKQIQQMLKEQMHEKQRLKEETERLGMKEEHLKDERAECLVTRMDKVMERINSDREIRYKEEQSDSWQAQGLSRCCGVKFKGFFSKKCSSCGKAKDYFEKKLEKQHITDIEKGNFKNRKVISYYLLGGLALWLLGCFIWLNNVSFMVALLIIYIPYIFVFPFFGKYCIDSGEKWIIRVSWCSLFVYAILATVITTVNLELFGTFENIYLGIISVFFWCVLTCLLATPVSLIGVLILSSIWNMFKNK